VYARLKMPVSLIRVTLPPCTSHVKASLASIFDSSATSPITFRGAYSIIADSAIGHSKRIKIVGEELKGGIGLKFEYMFLPFCDGLCLYSCFFGSYATSLKSSVTVTSNCRTFACECGCQAAIQKIRRTQSGLSRWFGGSSAAARKCNGTVYLLAEDDDSHWLGIKGRELLSGSSTLARAVAFSGPRERFCDTCKILHACIAVERI
jgi:hypothetical protein